MNFLGHLFLSEGYDDELMIGNFIGDFVRGSNFPDYSAARIQGVRLHRQIDTYTDQHPQFKASVIRLRNDFRKYAPVIADVFYDHLLARNWLRFHTLPLHVFAQEVYEKLNQKKASLPAAVQRFLPYMQEDNWLVNYAEFEGVWRSLRGISRRSKFVDNLEDATKNLEQLHEAFTQDFLNFLPDIQQFVQQNPELQAFSNRPK